jgi:V/A-type H+-transporting ATPase subunit F
VNLAVLADPETASGYRLAGLEVWVSTPKEAPERLASMVQSGRFALIGVDESLLPDPYAAVERLLRGRQIPVLVSIPKLDFAQAGDPKEYMRRLVREAIGFDVRL